MKLLNYVQNRIIKKLTPAVKYIVLINCVVAIITYIFYLVTGIELQYIFSIYPTYSEHFHFYQLFTFMFVHSSHPAHIIFNVLFLLIFSPFMELKVGFRNFIISYFLCAWIGFIFINHSYYLNKETVEKRINLTGINPNTIQLNKKHQVASNYFEKLTPQQQVAVEEYNWVTSKSNGASGALFGIIIFYIVLNILNYRKALFLALGFYLFYNNLTDFLTPSPLINGSCLAHFGGMVGGLLILGFYFIFMVKKNSSEARKIEGNSSFGRQKVI